MSRIKSRHSVLLAEFADPAHLLQAARQVRAEGYTRFDCHSPFPIHGMDHAMGLRRSRLGFVVAVCAALGALGGLTLQWWTSTVAYPVVVSGKPLFSWQAFIVVTFALMVLGGAFSAVLGLLHFTRLPRFHHPVFASENFQKVSDDGFFLSIESADPRFEFDKTRELLKSLGGFQIEWMPDD